MTTIKAVRATIQLGDINLDVFQLPNGNYQISQSQTTLAVGKPPKRMVQLAQSEKGQILVQSGFEKGLKVAVEGSKPVNLVPLEVAFQFWVLELSNGNSAALALVVACGVEALERRADAAFDVVRDEEERNERLKTRAKGKIARRGLTNAIQDYVEKHEKSEAYNKYVYSNCSDYLNKIILGAKAKQARDLYEVPKDSLLRNFIPVVALNELELAENLATRFIDERDVEPLEAVREACSVAFVKYCGTDD
jgi:hypothetical protein